ncbi:MAG: ornithine cyclodeaminase family protein [Longimicrobiales bacterium]
MGGSTLRLHLLSGRDVRAAVGMPRAIDVMAETFGTLSAGEAEIPLRLRLPATAGSILLMPAFLPGRQQLGAKLVSVFDGNPARGLPAISALMILLDAATGQPLAVLEGAELTALRTGAASGLATRLLAPEDAGVVALFGAGVQARTQLEAVRAVRSVREVRVVARSLASAQAFVAGLEDVPTRALRDPQAALADADLIITATSSAQPVFPGRAVEAGAHINAIGAYTPEMRELDGELIRRSALVVDSRAAALAEAGDVILALRAGLITETHIRAELGEIVNGTAEGRRTAAEITVFKSVGVALQDLALAREALTRAEALGLGTVVEL